MGRYLTSDDFVAQFGENEARQIAGTGDFNSLEGSQIDHELIASEIAFADELISGYVLSRHGWLAEQAVADIPNLLKGLGGDIVRYRLRDKHSGKGQVSDTVETRYRDALRRLEQIHAGKLDLVRDRKAGEDLANVELPDAAPDRAQISGGPSQAGAILGGYNGF